MILNWNYGTEMELELAAKTYTGIETSRTVEMPLTLIPLAIFLRTSAGGNAELCAYYRADQDGAFTMRVSTGGAAVSTRMQYMIDASLALNCSGGTVAQPASLECCILGVKQ